MGFYTSADGRGIVITCPSEKFFANLCTAFEVDWNRDPRLATIETRLGHQDELDRLIAGRCREFGHDQLLARLVAADVLAAPVNAMPEVVSDPRVLHNQMIVSTEHAKLGRVQVTGVPVKLHGTPGSVRLSPPVKGQHTAEILAELGYGPQEIAALARDSDRGGLSLSPPARAHAPPGSHHKSPAIDSSCHFACVLRT